MEINIVKSTEGEFTFHAQNENSTITLCAGEELSPGVAAFRPMQLVLVSLGSCMLIDVLNILQKQKIIPEDYDVQVTGTRAHAVPKVFKNITIHYKLKGNIPPRKVERAIGLSRDKYCSVYKMLYPTVEIFTKFSINE
ncbi:OsmC family protein [Luteibaculum oceani]|uniref:OsmC family protein n=1 Tax=Luteibaculum oceani TaxID=1294296 RepID=A0A5C6VAX0_9FLAO|nr:OsmC family protein [Luteibaculum oceani]TXC82030.1 OsmC family protein [Luteibaculum oceani]